MRTVAAVPALALLAGCAVGLAYPDLPPAVSAAALAAAAVTALVALRRWQGRLLIGTVAFAFAAGGTLLAADSWQHAWRPTLRLLFETAAREERIEAIRAGHGPPEDLSAMLAIEGVLREDATPTANGVALSVDVRWAGRAGSPGRRDAAANPVSGGVLLTVTGALATLRIGGWRAGRTIRTVALLHRPARYLNPGAPDQERALARRGSTLVGTVKSGALVEILARGSPPAEAAAAVRALARRAIHDSVGRWSDRSAGIVTAIVIGDRTGLDDRVEKRLQEAGTYHVIAISGGNIAILAGLTLALFRLAGVLGRVAMVSAAAGLVVYGQVVGGGASVARATLMAVVYFAGRAIDLRGPPLNSLAVAAALLAAIDPLQVAEPAFLLTFGATTAILAAVPVITPRRQRTWTSPLIGMLAASLAAEAALMPVSAVFFSRVTFAGLLLNFAAIPLMAVAQIAGMAIVPTFILMPGAAALIGAVAHLGAEGLVTTADLVTYVPSATWRVAPPGAVPLTVYYATLVAAWRAWRLRDRVGSGERRRARAVRLGATTIAIGAALWIVAQPWTMLARHGDGRLHVTFIDVGQGDSALVRLPRGAAFVIDSGGLGGTASFDVGDRVVAPLLRARGVGRLAGLVLTHGDADHIGGAPALVQEFRPLDIWEGIPVPPVAPLAELRAAAAQERLRWSNVQTNDVVAIDGVRIIVRHPPLADWERQRVRNDDSVVLEILWRDVSIVLTGDIGRGTEEAILGSFAPSPLRVVKVPHHGSPTSSSREFVHALAPRAAVVSVGRSNTFGHPAPAVLQRYAEAGAEIFRTDRDGAVEVDSDGRSLEVHTFTGRTLRLPAERNRSHENTKTRD